MNLMLMYNNKIVVKIAMVFQILKICICIGRTKVKYIKKN